MLLLLIGAFYDSKTNWKKNKGSIMIAKSISLQFL